MGLLAKVPALVHPDQDLFASTGAVHAAAAFDRSGAPLVRARRHRAPQRRRQGRGPAPPRRTAARHRPRSLRERPGWLRDRAEGVGGRVQRGGCGERAVGAGGRGGAAVRHDPRGVRARRPPVANLYTPGTTALMGLREQLTGWQPSGWVGWRPNGVGLQKPHHYRDMAKVAWANRAHPKYAIDVAAQGSVRRVRARRRRAPRLDDRRRAPVHDAAPAARAQHLRRDRSRGARRRRAADDADVHPAPAARPARPSDASPARRARVPSHHLGRGARRARREPGGDPARPRGALPHQPGHHERDLLRGRQGGAGDGDRQRRLGRPRVPCTVHGRAEGDDRCRPRRPVRSRT